MHIQQEYQVSMTHESSTSATIIKRQSSISTFTLILIKQGNRCLPLSLSLTNRWCWRRWCLDPARWVGCPGPCDTTHTHTQASTLLSAPSVMQILVRISLTLTIQILPYFIFFLPFLDLFLSFSFLSSYLLSRHCPLLDFIHDYTLFLFVTHISILLPTLNMTRSVDSLYKYAMINIA